MSTDGGTVRTRRLDLVPLGVAHAEEMAGVLADPALHTFIGGAPLTAPDLRARYERLAAGSPDPATLWLNWVVRLRAENRLTGTVQATLTEDGRVAEVAWVTGTEWQGRGIAREAAEALIALLAERGAHTIVAHVHPDHTASATVARAAGLTPTDRVEDGEIRWERKVPDLKSSSGKPHCGPASG
ncbi:GNAT family N-acetyltransferase [Streptomyces sp. NBC_00572]|uniref:GNAT family N-acetyltransferase n=1 Tax=Streptomyces sp. NBC_00572 TaxID=2903664 RepID=UPI00224D0A66|nr:GNAT family N-acetyltransferase [Streptomyces sp. NBC_00572]MCX4981332.1 GNAT family N-acetyltransferase [Streptomyces sp. NBC_00572]